MGLSRKAGSVERVTKDGEVLLSHNHIALLHGLLDRPNGIATSVTDWVVAAAPYSLRYCRYYSHWLLRKSIRTMHPSWIQRTRAGYCTRITLLPRGRAILDRTVPAHIHGIGPYQGLPKVSANRR